MVLISQDKPDHCHEATLRQLSPDLKDAIILAVPAAAKKIKSWRYFDPSRVCALLPFSESTPNTITRIALPASTPLESPGEVTVAFMPAKRDLTGLHNAIGITYRAPSSQASISFSSSISLPPTPPESPGSSDILASESSTRSLQRPRTLSLIYSPHGVTYTHIKPYAISHLVREAALPLTALLHSFDRVQNPWWLGGNISAGLPGGLEIAQNLLARAWISAHDEDKENSGFSVSNIKTRKYTVDEVRALLHGDDPRPNKGTGYVLTDVRVLDVGEEMVLMAN